MDLLGRRIKYHEDIYWENPIKSISPKPFLGEIIFPIDPRSKKAIELNELFCKFFCNERFGGNTDYNKFLSFINSPDKPILVIWGDVGIGKSWFIRYMFLQKDKLTNCYFGIIDILSIGVITYEETIYKQLCPILESYITHFNGSVEEGLLLYAKELLKNKRKKGTSEKVINANANILLNKWIPLEYTKKYAEILLLALEWLNNPTLFIVIDNIDRTGDEEQVILFNMAKRIFRSVDLRLIIPLRKSSMILTDRFKGLKEQTYDDIELSGLKIDKMLKKRFNFSKKGDDLSKGPYICDKGLKLTFPKLYDKIFQYESGELILKIAGNNVRESLLLIDRFINSNHLIGLRNISNIQYTIASLMLVESSNLDPSYPYIINLFNNEEQNIPGNTLIRFRILEYFYKEKKIDSRNNYFFRFMKRLGYNEERIKSVLSVMVGTSMIYSNKGIVANRFDNLYIAELGSFELTNIGKSYWEILLRMQWYYVSIKQGIIINQKYIRVDEVNKNEYITHADLCNFFTDEEDEERIRIKDWEKKNGRLSGNTFLNSPSEIAIRSLRNKRDETYLDGSFLKRLRK